MTEMSKVAIYGYDTHTSGEWLWFEDNLDAEVVAVGAPAHEVDDIRWLATALDASLCSSPEGLFEGEPFDTLLVTQPLEEAKRVTAAALARGFRVHTEVVPSTVTRSGGVIAAFGRDVHDTDRLLTVGRRQRIEHLALGNCVMPAVEELAGLLDAVPHRSLEDMVDAGDISVLYLSLPWSAAQEAIDYASKRGIRVVCDFLPEPGSLAIDSASADAADSGAATAGKRIDRVRRVALYAGTEQTSELLIRRMVQLMNGSGGYPVAYIDGDFDRAWRIGADFDIPTFPFMGEAIVWANPDRLMLAVPPAGHARPIVEALESGLNVACAAVTPRVLPAAVASGVEPFGYAVLGCRDEATAEYIRTVARVLPGRGGAVVAVADGEFGVARELGDDLGVPAFCTIDAVIRWPAVHGVLMVGSPSDYEEEIVLLLEYGLPVFRNLDPAAPLPRPI